ncbi:MAG: succinate dehydrogenase/fumarate reductase iron-sulfur subunit [Candidatus Nezhaarchaeota archaeon]|nr:succinate dehydrogenase/fumarate reductase iron-sulfur subunit [Candidatus Nezhaarchaeota archaeon]MCX8142373.1 succinate dehydrogenase/fumarate reductase iron-sulfur subunit [Candidatus Nezhaarchaeota archaeon]MDW8050654.1 fumarate reductase (CoM/CoB) subunit TfrB [Nitrososphaerota archaeon]
MSQDRPTVKLKVFRYDPTIDEKPRYETYEVPYYRGMKVLDALIYVHDNYDSTLAFRYSCKIWRCGSCAVMVDGDAKPACRAEVEPGREYVIEPLANLPVIRDLVVDFSKIYKRFTALGPYFVTTKPRGNEPARVPGRKYEDFIKVAGCIECWSCISVCPAVKVAWAEMAGPGLIVALAQSAYNPLNEHDVIPIAFAQGLYSCTTCGKCAEVCPEEIAIPEVVFEKMRAIAVNRGIGPLPGHLVPKELIEKTGRSVVKKETPFLETIEVEVFKPAEKTRSEPIDRVGYFTGCLADYRLQSVAKSTVDILLKLGVEVVVPKDQVCCGSPMIRIGALSALNDLVKRNIASFERFGVKTIVTPCAGCSLTLKKNYPELVKKILGREMPFKVYHLSEYIVDVLGAKMKDLKEVKMKVTWHDPCHLRRGQGIYKEPRELLTSIPGIQLIEMRKPDQCCGAGGGVRSGKRELSDLIRADKIKIILETGAEAVVTECPFCVIQIRDALDEAGYKDINVFYLEDLIRKAMK